MSKLTLTLAFGAGYVVGARAGRERYEQIRTGARKVAADPRVQSAAASVKDKAGEVASTVADSAKDAAGSAVENAREKVHRETSISAAP